MAPMTDYSQAPKVILGSLEYIISDAVLRQPAEEFVVGLRSGLPQYDQREGSFFRNFNDFRGGFGVRAGDQRVYPDRFWAARDVRTYDSEMDITLAPLMTEATLGAIVPSASGGLMPGGGWTLGIDPAGVYTLYGAMGNRVFYTTGTTSPTFTALTPGGGPASAQTFSLLHHVNPTNAADRGVFWATGAADEIWKYNEGFGTWSQPAVQFSDSLIEFDRKLLSVFAGQVSISADAGANWEDIVKVDSAPTFAPFFAGVGLDPYGQLMPYLVSNGILYIIDVWTHQAIPIDLGLPSSVTHAVVWQDGEVVATDGYFVKAYHPNRPVKDMGFNRDNGPFTQAFIRQMYAIAGKWLVAQVDVGSNLFNLYVWDGNGWHVVTGSDAIFGPFGLWSNPGHRSMIMYNGASIYNPAQELFVMGYANNRPYIQHMSCDAFKNPQLNANHKYAGSVDGYVQTYWDDGGFAEMDGTAIEFEIHGKFTTSEYVEVYYQINNDESAWTLLGSTNSTATVHRLRFGTTAGKGISFKNIRFQFVFKRGATNTLTPVLRSAVFKYLKIPRLRSTFTFTVDVTQTARHRGVTEEVVIDTLYGLVDDTPLTDFAYLGETTTFVRFSQMPRVDKQWQDGTTKTSVMRVTVEEPV